MSSDGWHTASEENSSILDFTVQKPGKKINVKKIRLDLFVKLLNILKAINAEFSYRPKEKSKFLEYKRLEKSECNKIVLFKKLSSIGIPAKLHIAINAEINFMIEVFLPEIIEKQRIKLSGLVCSIGADGSLVNTTILYSSSFKHFSIFDHLVSELQSIVHDFQLFKCFRKKFVEDGIVLPKSFDQQSLFSTIPKSIKSLRYHPFYAVESLIRQNQFIFPKRPLLGYFKGEPMYPKKNVQKMRSEKEWFRLGKKVSKENYKIVNGVKLYRKYEVEDIVIDDISGRTMLFFHKNHIPKGFFYSKNELSVFAARLINVRFCECIVGFRTGLPVIEGVFVEEKYKDVFYSVLSEFKFNKMVMEITRKGDKFYRAWDHVFKKIDRFLELKNMFE